MAYTVEQWMADMERLDQTSDAQDAEGLTTEEWSEKLDWTITRARNWVRAGLKLGRMKLGRPKMILRMDGHTCPVQTYAIIEAT